MRACIGTLQKCRLGRLVYGLTGDSRIPPSFQECAVLVLCVERIKQWFVGIFLNCGRIPETLIGFSFMSHKEKTPKP